MTFREYQDLARRTQNPKLAECDKRDHALFGMTSEIGEVCGLFQHVYQGKSFKRDDLIKELGDIMWFFAELCDVFAINMDQVAVENIEKLRKRFPEGFDEVRSAKRHELEAE